MDETLLTLKYFDLFDYPLKKGELFKWQFGRQTADGGVEEQDGYYFLPGRSDIIKIRKEREMVSLKKIRKAQRVARILGLVPGVKMIAIVSNLGYLNADKEADIDLFIVTRKDRIWTVRFWTVVLMMILGQRPSKKTIRDKICLSYYVTEDNLNLEKTKIGEPDIHLIYLLSQYLPIYSENQIWQKFVEENKWINRYLPNFKYSENDQKFLIKPRFVWLKKLIGQTQLGFEEKLYKNIQMKKMAKELRSAMNRGDKKVIINDQMLKLHINDKRDEINRKFEK